MTFRIILFAIILIIYACESTTEATQQQANTAEQTQEITENLAAESINDITILVKKLIEIGEIFDEGGRTNGEDKSTEIAYFKQFKTVATDDELVELISHKSSVIRAAAYLALYERDTDKMDSVIEQLKNDEEIVYVTSKDLDDGIQIKYIVEFMEENR